MEQFWLAYGNEIYGPMSEAEARAIVHSNVAAARESYVWREGSLQWVPVSTMWPAATPQPRVVARTHPAPPNTAKSWASRIAVVSVAAALFSGVVGLAAWYLWPEPDTPSPWAAPRFDAESALEQMIDANGDSTRVRAALASVHGVCDKIVSIHERVEASLRVLTRTSVPWAASPPEIELIMTVCELDSSLAEVGDPEPVAAPTRPEEPIYEEPEYDGSFKLEGEYYQDAAGRGVVLNRKNVWYWIPNGVIDGHKKRGQARGYVKPTGRRIKVEGKNVRVVHVVDVKEYRADQRRHKAAVEEAKQAHEAALALYEAALARYPGELAAYDTWRLEREKLVDRAERLSGALEQLGSSLGLDESASDRLARAPHALLRPELRPNIDAVE